MAGLALPLGVSEAQSAVVNDSPVDCQSRRPGPPAGGLSAKLTERALTQITQLLKKHNLPYTQEESPTHITLTLTIPKP